jgi:MFS transporter, SP family, sugar:H+ symporter
MGLLASKSLLETLISKTDFNTTLVLSILLLILSAFSYGFCDQAFASCQAMDSFIREFGKENLKSKTFAVEPLFTSLYNSLKAGGQIVGNYQSVF